MRHARNWLTFCWQWLRGWLKSPTGYLEMGALAVPFFVWLACALLGFWFHFVNVCFMLALWYGAKKYMCRKPDELTEFLMGMTLCFIFFGYACAGLGFLAGYSGYEVAVLGTVLFIPVYVVVVMDLSMRTEP